MSKAGFKRGVTTTNTNKDRPMEKGRFRGWFWSVFGRLFFGDLEMRMLQRKYEEENQKRLIKEALKEYEKEKTL